jgi:hypothetical protein
LGGELDFRPASSPGGAGAASEIPPLPTLPSGRRRRIYARVSPDGVAAVPITWEQIERRIHRLNALTMGLMREGFIWTKDNLHDHPLLFVETRAYLKAIRDALAGVESARIVLAKARRRQARGGREANVS